MTEADRAALGTRVSRSRVEQPPAPLAKLLGRIEQAYHPLQVWLFGSHARGDARPTSDWDLLVVVTDDAPDEVFDLTAAWNLQTESGVGADIIPCTRSTFQADITVPQTLPFEAAREGRLLLAG